MGSGKRGPMAGLGNMLGLGGGIPSPEDMAKLAEKMPGGLPGMSNLPSSFPGALPGGLKLPGGLPPGFLGPGKKK
jgi:signal recognition particle subunit SRP54